MKSIVASPTLFLFLALCCSYQSRADEKPFTQNQYQVAAEKVAAVDGILKHCAEEIILDGEAFVQMQTIWRVMLLSGSYEVSQYYNAKLRENDELYERLATEYGSNGVYCASMKLWSLSNFQSNNPFKEFNLRGNK